MGDDEIDRSHVEGVEDGGGCLELWEHLSVNRDGTLPDDNTEDA